MSDVGSEEQLPLAGRRVVVTRTRTQASGLVDRLRRCGAIPVEVPTIEITEPSDQGVALRRAVEHLPLYDWIIFTSPNGASRFCDALVDGRSFGTTRIAAIGTGTAHTLRERNVVADLVPERFVAEGLLESFADLPGPAGNALLAQAEQARPVLLDGLVDAGWDVDVVPLYRTVPVTPTPEARAALEGADVVTFTSSSTVTNFVAAFGVEAATGAVACIGPITAATANDLGLAVDVQAAEHTIDGLVTALENHFAGGPRG